jgi:GNAT superfamily N-acetyltransferase
LGLGYGGKVLSRTHAVETPMLNRFFDSHRKSLGHEITVILIREADENDNDALNELQKKCPMGTSIVLGVDSSPDYFARSRPFKDWHVFVAVEDNVIVGSAGFATYDACVEGKQIKTAYEYGFVVDPLRRRKGIAEKLQSHIEKIALDGDVDLLHLDVIEDNIPSIRLFSKMGFEKLKDCVTISLMPYKTQTVVADGNIRGMEEADVENVTDLINEMYRSYDFFDPFEPEDFVEYVKRIPHFDFHNILVFENNGKLEACLGIWDYDKVRRYIVERLNLRLSLQTYLIRLIGLFVRMPYVPRPGEPLLSYNLATIAYKKPESMLELLKKAVNTALDNKINFIHVTIDPSSPLDTILSRFRYQTRMKLHILAKPLGQVKIARSGERKLYIDATEI